MKDHFLATFAEKLLDNPEISLATKGCTALINLLNVMFAKKGKHLFPPFRNYGSDIKCLNVNCET